jgi:hypothetical protein
MDRADARVEQPIRSDRRGGASKVAPPPAAAGASLAAATADVLALQRTAGNGAVARLLARPEVLQRTLDDAVVAAAHLELNVRLPYSDDGMLDVLAQLSAANRSIALGQLKSALLKNRPALEQADLERRLRERIEQRLKEQSDSELSEGMEDDANAEFYDPAQHEPAERAMKAALECALSRMAAAVAAAKASDEYAPWRAPLIEIQAALASKGAEMIQLRPADTEGNAIAVTMANGVIALLKPWFALSSVEHQAHVLVHEAAHAVVHAVDVAYEFERLFFLLAEKEHLTNAESYAQMMEKLNKAAPLVEPARMEALPSISSANRDAAERALAEASHCFLWASSNLGRIADSARQQPWHDPLPPILVTFAEAVFKVGVDAVRADKLQAAAVATFASYLHAVGGRLAADLNTQKVTLIAITDQSGQRALATSGGGGMTLTYRPTPDPVTWMCAAVLRDLEGRESKQALALGKALVAASRAHPMM